MQSLRRAVITLLAVTLLGAGMARGASTTDYTDQWWNAGESGWGVSVFQQWDTIFACFFVYGADGKPTWFVAVATPQAGGAAGHDLFTGKLYVTTGPYFGGPFNSAPVVEREAGTFTFDASAVNAATIGYVVDGTPVQKNVTRQTWGNDDLSGSYYGGQSGIQTLCGEDDGPYEESDFIDIVHDAGNSITMKWTDRQNRILTIIGVYSQQGHLGQVAVTGGSASQAPGITFTGTLFEIERSVSGITGRGHLVFVGGPCTWDGRWGGVRR